MTAAERLARIEAIAVGTSSGGVEALSLLLPALPRTLRVPVFVVLHIPRDQPSLLAGIFAPKCAVPVVEAEDKMPIAPGTVYFAPPDYHMLVDGEYLAMSADEPVHYSRPSIDVLFESAADTYGQAMLGIVLTGGSEDGSAGLAAVDRAGGVTVVQHPEDAQMPMMVDAALRRVAADFVLPLSGIAELLSTAVPQ